MGEKFIRVYTAEGQLNAEMVKALLESTGIQVVLSGESLGTTFGLTTGPLAEVDLLVPSEQVKDARSVIEAMERGDLENSE